MEELLILKVLLKKEEYLKYKKYLESINLENESKIILDTIGMYFDEYIETEEISLDELKAYFYMKNPLYKSKESFMIIFDNLISLEINNNGLLQHTIKNLIERYFASSIIEDLTQVLSGSKYGVLSGIEHKLSEYHDVVASTNEEESPFIENTLANLLEAEVTSPGIKWRLHCLNKDIGDLRGGSLGHVYARPDTGKTSFIASEVSNFAKQLEEDEIILWANNEEKGTKVKLRLYCALLNKTKEQISADPEAAEAEFMAADGNKIKIYDSAIITVSDLENLLKKYKVRVLVIDQGDKVKFRGDKELAEHARLKVVYGIFRELAKEYECDIITAGQASASAEGMMWLTLDMMDNSKTGKPGELDYALGIGFNSDEGKEAMRFIHAAKNKMKDGVHGKHFVVFDPLRARYKDLNYEGNRNGVLPQLA